MKMIVFLFSVLSLTTLVGCGQDVAQRSNRPPVEGNTEGIGAESAVLRSHVPHQPGKAFSLATEIEWMISGNIPDGVRPIPSMESDDESGGNAITLNVRGRPTVNCGFGVGYSGLAQRIANCASANQATANWDGTVFGGAGESAWRLVAKSGNQEVWQDRSTGLVWTDVIATANWCNASGNDDEDTPPLTQINCNAIGGEKLCQNWAGLHPDFNWRLPTRNDFLQADLNGLRIINKEKTAEYWTATVQAASTGRISAWTYSVPEGTLQAKLMNTAFKVRCVGVALNK